MATTLESRELLHLSAPVSVAVDQAGLREDGSISVKGFASVETKDRSGDVVPPEEFRIEQFMASPSLLVNHKHWVDQLGNGVGAGRPAELYAAKLANLPEDPDNYGVVDLKTKEQVSKYPKAKVPNLKAGDRGLFVVAEVTQPDVAKMVDQGELSAFSWRGLTTVDYRISKSTGTTERVFRDIDLYEISLVHVPDNPDSTFVVGKSVHVMRLSKDRFETPKMASAYMEAHNLRNDAVREDDEAYYSMQLTGEAIDLSRLVTVKMADGVQAIAGPLKQGESTSGWLARTLGQDSVDGLTQLFSEKAARSNKISSTKESVTMSEDTQKAADAVECPGGQEMVDGECVATKEAQALESLGENIAEKTVEGLKPLFEAQSEAMKTVGEALTTMNGLVEKMAVVDPVYATEETATATEETAEEVAVETADVEAADNDESIEAEKKPETAPEVVEVLKSLNAKLELIGKSTAPQEDRDERIESAKSVTTDPNSVMDSVFPFLS
jgi:hypothetical protein